MHESVVPAKFQIDPLDVVAYDRWQDAEGLVDASPVVREAWRAFAPEWRRVRAADLAPPLGSRVPLLVDVPEVLRAVARRRRSGSAVRPWQARAWWRLVLRVGCPDTWRMVERVLAGAAVGPTADAGGVTVRHLRNAVALACCWWGDIAGEERGRRLN